MWFDSRRDYMHGGTCRDCSGYMWLRKHLQTNVLLQRLSPVSLLIKDQLFPVPSIGLNEFHRIKISYGWQSFHSMTPGSSGDLFSFFFSFFSLKGLLDMATLVRPSSRWTFDYEKLQQENSSHSPRLRLWTAATSMLQFWYRYKLSAKLQMALGTSGWRLRHHQDSLILFHLHRYHSSPSSIIGTPSAGGFAGFKFTSSSNTDPIP